jgi:hypothetical protein
MRSTGWPALFAGLVASFTLLVLADAGRSDDEEKELREGLVKLATALEKKDDATAKKLAGELAKKFGTDSVMYMHAERAKGGLGVGDKADAAKPDGIEKKVIVLSKKALADDQLNAEAEALTQMGWRLAAIAEVTAAHAPDKDRKVWVDSTAEYKAAGVELAEAARAKKADMILKAAKKADASCLKCHDTFR